MVPLSLKVASPVGNASVSVDVKFGVMQVKKDLDPQNLIEEVIVIEGEGEVEFGARSKALAGRDAVKVQIGIVQKKGYYFFETERGIKIKRAETKENEKRERTKRIFYQGWHLLRCKQKLHLYIHKHA